MSSSDDDDFGPAIPAHLLSTAQQQQHGSESVGAKRERSPDAPAASSVVDLTPEQRATQSNLRLLPSADVGRFERVYEHAAAIDDVACAGGAILTIDATGTLRWWLKVPRGVLFALQQPLFTLDGAPATPGRFMLLTSSTADDALVVAVDTQTGAARTVHPRELRVGRALALPGLAAAAAAAGHSCRPALHAPPAASALPPLLVLPRTDSTNVLLVSVADGGTATTVSSAMPHTVTAIALHPTQPFAIAGSAQGVIGYAALVLDASQQPRWSLINGMAGADPAAKAIVSGSGAIEFDRWQRTGLFAPYRDHSGALGVSDIAVAPSGATFAAVLTNAKDSGAEHSGSVYVFKFATGMVLAKIPRVSTLSPLVGLLVTPGTPAPSTTLLFDTPQTSAGPVLLRAAAFVDVCSVVATASPQSLSLGSADVPASQSTLLPLSAVRLLRAHAPPSQQLRDRVTGTPLGATLAPEDMRRLFVLARGEQNVADDPLVVAIGGGDRRQLVIFSNFGAVADEDDAAGSSDPRLLSCEQLWSKAMVA